MNIVTGADGVVGRGVSRALREAGETVIPVVRRVRPWSHPDSVVCSGPDDPHWESLGRRPVRAIVHLAAAVPHAAEYPDTEASAALTRALDRRVAALADAVAAPLIYMSTCGLYRRTDPAVKDESAALEAASPYFAAKLEGEALMLTRPATTVFRLAAPVGPGLQPGLVVSRFLARARANADIEVWGSGQREQDFIDVRDCGALIVRSLAAPHPGIFNLASGRAVTMRALADAVVTAVGGGRVCMVPRPDPHDNETARYDITRACNTFQWRPRHDLHESLAVLAREEGTAV
jgi:nucleoside-diphosphate-sugar epimerase